MAIQATMYVTRDKDAELTLHTAKPRKSMCGFWVSDGEEIELDSALFPEVKWTDAEPTEVNIVRVS